MRGRGVIAGVGVAVVLAVAVVVAALHSVSSGCAYPQPVASLSPALRAVGGYDQPLSDDARSLEQTALSAAAVDHPHLLGTTASAPVTIHSRGGTGADAEVVALTDPSRAGVAGAVVFLRDCSGRLYYSGSEEFATPLPAFPSVSAGDAAHDLNTSAASLRLVYEDSPLRPEWEDPASGRTVAALSGGG